MNQHSQCTLDKRQMGQRRLGNTKLIEHGIQTEQSDIRAHVSVEGQCVYVFHTSDAVSVLKKAPRAYTRMPIFSHFRAARIQTADGYLVPPGDIHSCRRVLVPDDIFAAAGFDRNDRTSVKGRKAVRVVSQTAGNRKPSSKRGYLSDKLLEFVQ